MPSDFELTPERRAFATKLWDAKLVDEDADDQWGQFCDHHRAKGSRFDDWPAAWRTWVRNTAKYAIRDGRVREAPPVYFDPKPQQPAAEVYTLDQLKLVAPEIYAEAKELPNIMAEMRKHAVAGGGA